MKKVKIIFPDGSIGEIDQSDLQSALNAGAKLYSEAGSLKKKPVVKFADGSEGEVDENDLDSAIKSGATLVKKKEAGDYFLRSQQTSEPFLANQKNGNAQLNGSASIKNDESTVRTGTSDFFPNLPIEPGAESVGNAAEKAGSAFFSVKKISPTEEVITNNTTGTKELKSGDKIYPIIDVGDPTKGATPVYPEALEGTGFSDVNAFAADFRARLSNAFQSGDKEEYGRLVDRYTTVANLSQMKDNPNLVTQQDLRDIGSIINKPVAQADLDVLDALNNQKQLIRSAAREAFEADPKNLKENQKTGHKWRDERLWKEPDTSVIDKYIRKVQNSLTLTNTYKKADALVKTADVRSTWNKAFGDVYNPDVVLGEFNKEGLSDLFFTGLDRLQYSDPARKSVLQQRVSEGKPLASNDVAELINIGAGIENARNLEELQRGEINNEEFQRRSTELNDKLNSNLYQRKDVLFRTIANAIGEYYASRPTIAGDIAGKYMVSDKEIYAVPKEYFQSIGIDITRPESKEALKRIAEEEGALPFQNAIPKTGVVREFIKGFGSTIEGIESTIGSISKSDDQIYLEGRQRGLTDVPARTEYWDKQYGTLADMFSGAGQFVSQYLLMAGGGKLVAGLGEAAGGSKALKLISTPESATATAIRQGGKFGNLLIDKSQRISMLVEPWMQSYGQYYEDALQKTGDPGVSKFMAFTNASMESLSEQMFNNVKFGNEVLANFRSGLNYNQIAKIFDKGFTKEAIQEARGLIEGGLARAIKLTGKTAGELAQESFEEVPVAMTNFIMDAVGGKDLVKDRSMFSEMKDAFVGGLTSFSIPFLVGLGGKLKANMNRKFDGVPMMIAAQNRDLVAESLHNLHKEGQLTDEELNQKMQTLNTAAAVLRNTPKFYSNGRQIMSEEDKVKWLDLTMQAKKLQQEINAPDADEVVKIENQNRLKEINAKKLSIYNGQEAIDNTKKIFTDFDETLWDNKTQSLTPLGEEMKKRIAAGEDVTVLTSRGLNKKDGSIDDNVAAAGEEFIAQQLGLPQHKIISSLTPEQKAQHLLPGSTYYNENDTELEAARSVNGVNVIDTKTATAITEKDASEQAISAAKDITDEHLRKAFISDPVAGLKEVAAQVKSSDKESVQNIYGEKIVSLAEQLHPGEDISAGAKIAKSSTAQYNKGDIVKNKENITGEIVSQDKDSYVVKVGDEFQNWNKDDIEQQQSGKVEGAAAYTGLSRGDEFANPDLKPLAQKFGERWGMDIDEKTAGQIKDILENNEKEEGLRKLRLLRVRLQNQAASEGGGRDAEIEKRKQQITAEFNSKISPIQAEIDKLDEKSDEAKVAELVSKRTELEQQRDDRLAAIEQPQADLAEADQQLYQEVKQSTEKAAKVEPHVTMAAAGRTTAEDSRNQLRDSGVVFDKPILKETRSADEDLHDFAFGQNLSKTQLNEILTGPGYTIRQRGMAAAYLAALRLLNNNPENFIGRLFAKAGAKDGGIRIVYDTRKVEAGANPAISVQNGVVIINAFRLGNLLVNKFGGEKRFTAWLESALQEETIHLAALHVATDEEINQVAAEMTDKQKERVRQFYDSPGAKLTDYQLAQEYLRMIYQEKVFGTTTEMMQPKPAALSAFRDIAQRLLTFIKKAFAGTENPKAQEIIRKLDSFVKGKERWRVGPGGTQRLAASEGRTITVNDVKVKKAPGRAGEFDGQWDVIHNGQVIYSMSYDNGMGPFIAGWYPSGKYFISGRMDDLLGYNKAEAIQTVVDKYNEQFSRIAASEGDDLGDLWDEFSGKKKIRVTAEDFQKMSDEAKSAFEKELGDMDQDEQSEIIESYNYGQRAYNPDNDPIKQYKLITTKNESSKYRTEITASNVFGEDMTSDDRFAALVGMLDSGQEMIALAQQMFGGADVDTYGGPLLRYIKGMVNGEPKKAILLGTLLGEIKDKIERSGSRELQPLYDQAFNTWKMLMHDTAQTLVAGRLLRLFRDKYMSDIYEDIILEEQEAADLRGLKKSISEDEFTAEDYENYRQSQQKGRSTEEVNTERKETKAKKEKKQAEDSGKKKKPKEAYEKKYAEKEKEVQKKHGDKDSLYNLIKKKIEEIKDKCK